MVSVLISVPTVCVLTSTVRPPGTPRSGRGASHSGKFRLKTVAVGEKLANRDSCHSAKFRLKTITATIGLANPQPLYHF